jgi:AcrR family transcriptional regulator
MTKHKSSDERRQQVQRAAKECFVESGYASTTMQDISRRSGLSKGGIYFHFDSKMDVFLSLVDAEYQESITVIEEVAFGPGSVTDKLGELANGFLANFAEESGRAKFFIVMSEVAIREPDVKIRLIELQEHFLERLTVFVEQAIENEVFRPTNARAVALFLKALMDGLEGNTALGIDMDLSVLIPAGLQILFQGLMNARG